MAQDETVGLAETFSAIVFTHGSDEYYGKVLGPWIGQVGLLLTNLKRNGAVVLTLERRETELWIVTRKSK